MSYTFISRKLKHAGHALQMFSQTTAVVFTHEYVPSLNAPGRAHVQCKDYLPEMCFSLIEIFLSDAWVECTGGSM